MKRRFPFFDAFILGGFAANFTNSFINPLYITLILSNLSPRLISAGSVIASAFPIAIGILMENGRIFAYLYAVLPVIMAIEVAAVAASLAVAKLDVSAYYLLTMLIFGALSTSVMYLLQRLKERRYEKRRAAFDRRCAMADAVGYLAGSALFMVLPAPIKGISTLAVITLVQTVFVYALFLNAYRKILKNNRNLMSAEEDPPQQAAMGRFISGLARMSAAAA